MKSLLTVFFGKSKFCEKERQQVPEGSTARAGCFSKKVLKDKRAVSFIEYVALTVFLLAAFYIMEGYVIRGMLGKWQEASETFGHGRQYDPREIAEGGTAECMFHYTQTHPTVEGFWMDARFYRENCNCSLSTDHCEACRVLAGAQPDAQLCEQTP